MMVQALDLFFSFFLFFFCLWKYSQIVIYAVHIAVLLNRLTFVWQPDSGVTRQLPIRLTPITSSLINRHPTSCITHRLPYRLTLFLFSSPLYLSYSTPFLTSIRYLRRCLLPYRHAEAAYAVPPPHWRGPPNTHRVSSHTEAIHCARAVPPQLLIMLTMLSYLLPVSSFRLY